MGKPQDHNPQPHAAPAGPDRRCKFVLAPPRHFLYPAILLLLAEEPRHGYRLVDSILRFGFGPVDRPSVYRALSELEGDGLLDSWSATQTAGCTRHVYGLTDPGRETLAEWAEVLDQQRRNLEAMVRRFDKLDERANPRTDPAQGDGAGLT